MMQKSTFDPRSSALALIAFGAGLFIFAQPLFADEENDAPPMHSASTAPALADANAYAPGSGGSGDSGKMGPEKHLYQQSIQTTKQSIAHDTLDVFYRDALDFYHERQFDRALELLDKIYSIDPGYEDVASLRNSIHRMQSSHELASHQETIREWMHKGDKALSKGQNTVAISYWQKALQIDPHYEPAQKEIDEVNRALARKQFEAGYFFNQRGDFENALEAWSKAIELDPTYKQRGLLVLMSKVELAVRRDQGTKLAAQAYDQYQHNDLEGALRSYEDLLKVDPRHDEGHRMSTKIKLQLGQVAFKAGQAAAAKGQLADAIQQWEKSKSYGYEPLRSQTLVADAQKKMKRIAAANAESKHAHHGLSGAHSPVATAVATSTQAVVAAPAVVTPADSAAAMEHYRQGLIAIKAQDFHRAIDELDTASKLDPSNERILMARERARQQWTGSQAGSDNSPPQ